MSLLYPRWASARFSEEVPSPTRTLGRLRIISASPGRCSSCVFFGNPLTNAVHQLPRGSDGLQVVASSCPSCEIFSPPPLALERAGRGLEGASASSRGLMTQGLGSDPAGIWAGFIIVQRCFRPQWNSYSLSDTKSPKKTNCQETDMCTLLYLKWITNSPTVSTGNAAQG